MGVTHAWFQSQLSAAQPLRFDRESSEELMPLASFTSSKQTSLFPLLGQPLSDGSTSSSTPPSAPLSSISKSMSPNNTGPITRPLTDKLTASLHPFHLPSSPPQFCCRYPLSLSPQRLRRRFCPMLGYLVAFAGLSFGVILGLFLCSLAGVVSLSPCSSSGLSSGRRSCCNRNFSWDKLSSATDSSDSRRRKRVLIGVMTAEKFLDNRARVAYNTWSQHIPGDVLFFTREGAVSKEGGPPSIALPGVDDSYPPQKKSFMMLRYMYENYGDDYDWFVRADDDVHIDGKRLGEFLSSVDSDQLWLLGQAGKGVAEELGKLSLEHDENFCMGGPGMVLSSSLLQRVGPHLAHCLSHMRTSHEDVEVGRCVRDWTNVQCTWAYEMQQLFYHNYVYREGTGFPYVLDGPETVDAITMHPVKDPHTQYAVHVRSLRNQIKAIRQEERELRREVESLFVQPSGGVVRPPGEIVRSPGEIVWSPGGDGDELSPCSPESDQNDLSHNVGLNMIPSELFTEKLLFSHLLSQPVKAAGGNWWKRVRKSVISFVSRFNKAAVGRKTGELLTYRMMFSGYRQLVHSHGFQLSSDVLLTRSSRRVDPVTGRVMAKGAMVISAEYRLNCLFPFVGINVRHVNVTVPIIEGTPKSQAIKSEDGVLAKLRSGMVWRLSMEETKVDSSHSAPESLPFIELIVPLSGRFAAAKRFIEHIAVLLHSEGLNRQGDACLHITVILYESPDREKTLSLIRYSLPPASVTLIFEEGQFTRGQAIHRGITSSQPRLRPRDDRDILFIVDIDMAVNAATLFDLRMNTQLGRTLYFPIVFSQYDPRTVCCDESYLTQGNPSHGNYQSPANNVCRHNLLSSPTQSMLWCPTVNEITEDSGYFRSFGFGILSFCRGDYASFKKGVNQAANSQSSQNQSEAILNAWKGLSYNLSIRGWGMEDVDLYNQALVGPLEVVRAASPGLVHIYHPSDCDTPSLSGNQQRMCRGSQASIVGSRRGLHRWLSSPLPGIT